MNSTIKSLIELNKPLSQKTAGIAAPLSENFGIGTLGYRKFFSDGTSFGFSSNQDWAEFFYQNLFQQRLLEYEKEITETLNNNRRFFLRVGTPHQDSLLFSALYKMNIWNSLSIYNPTPDGVEAFYFTSGKDNHDIVDFYVNHIKLFERFVIYFKDKISLVMPEEDIKRLAGFSIEPTIFDGNKTDSGNSSKMHQFNMSTPLNKIVVSCADKLVTFTRREFECLEYLAKGKGIKDIAIALQLSPRTIESYMENMKRKTCTSSKSQLIDIFLQNFPFH